MIKTSLLPFAGVVSVGVLEAESRWQLGEKCMGGEEGKEEQEDVSFTAFKQSLAEKRKKAQRVGARKQDRVGEISVYLFQFGK